MRRSVTLGSWERRGRLVASCAAVLSSAVAVLAVVLNQRLLLVAAIVTLLGASAQALILARSERLAQAQDEALLERRLRVPVARVDAIDPTAVGVDPAAQSLLDGGEVPRYLPRDVDARLREAILAAVAGEGPWLVVLTGASKVGKSRTLLYALLSCLRGVGADRAAKLVMVAPADGDAVRALLRPGEGPDLRGGHPVLWLDDLEPFVAQEVSWQTLREWHERFGAVVLATYGGKGSERVAAANTREMAALTDTILPHATEIALEKTNASELAGLPAGLSEYAVAAIEKHGLAAIMVAAPALDRKLTTRRHAPSEPESPEGAAIVYAAVDWAFCGRLDPLSRRSLHRLWRSYLPPGSANTKKAFDAGLEWALRPVAGSIALLRSENGFAAFDYIVTSVKERASSMAPRPETWARALKTTDRGQAFMVGTMAVGHRQTDHAIVAFRIAASHGENELSDAASFNLGASLRLARKFPEARDAFQAVINSPRSEHTHRARINLGFALEGEGDLQGACDAFQQVVDSNDRAWAAPAARQLASALRIRSADARARGDLRTARNLLWEASSTLERITKLDEQHEDVPQMRFELGVLLEQRGISIGALVTFSKVVESADRDYASLAALHLGGLREQLDNKDGAREAYEQAIALRPHAYSAKQASFKLAVLLEEQGAIREARTAYEHAISASGEDLKLASRLRLALLMEKQDDPKAASALFREAIASDPQQWSWLYDAAEQHIPPP
jgi:tetratricopeptide (TPR) repeat protein